jgi:hypothetical protein
MRLSVSFLQLARIQLVAGLLLGGCIQGAKAQRILLPADSGGVPRAPFIFGAYAQGSIIISHTQPVAHLVSSHPLGFELNVQRQTTGAAPWHAWYKYPKVGLALVYFDYRNPLLGRSYTATVYLSKSISRTARHDFSFRLGTGLAYFPVHYDLYTDRKNTFISSPLNATLQLRFEYDLALSEHLGLLLALGLHHYSNGATSKPNFGINLPTVAVGLNYHQQRPAPVRPGYAPAPLDVGHNFLNVSTSVAFKKRSAFDPTTYLVNSVTLAAGRRLSRKSNLLVGLEGFYDRSLRAAQLDTARATTNLPDTRKASAFVGHELLLGRLAMVTHLGAYFYNPYKSNPFIYERVGLKYHFTPWLFGVLDLKVHLFTADALELKVGARLGR